MSPAARPGSPPWWPAVLDTPRLLLRPVVAADVPSVERLWRDERARRYLGGPVSEERIAIRRARLPGTPGAFAVEQRTTCAVVGLVTVEPRSFRGGTEVAYTLLPEVWGRGLGREAVGEVIRWARDLPGTRSVVAVTRSANASSRGLLESVGMLPRDELVEYGERQTVYRLTL